MKTTALMRRELNDGRNQGRPPYPIIWTCQHCDKSEPCPVCNITTVVDNIEDGQEIYLEDDSECGLTFAYHLACAEIADASGELFDYEQCGGRLQ